MKRKPSSPNAQIVRERDRAAKRRKERRIKDWKERQGK